MKDGGLALWTAIRAVLVADSAVSALVAARVFDEAPPADAFSSYVPFVSRGPVDSVPFHNEGERGSSITIQIDCWAWPSTTATDQKIVCGQINAAVIDAIWGDAVPSPSGWKIQQIWQPRIRLVLDPDGITGHGSVTVTADMSPDIFIGP